MSDRWHHDQTIHRGRGWSYRVEDIATARALTVARIALAWLLAHGAVPIPGNRRRDRQDENAGAVDISLSVEELLELDVALPASEISGGRDHSPAVAGVDG
ncbi:MAG: aldo/keto reductase [Glaciihabitans sp.]|nr:aldo/keto reductase [Glaciihabitans sp.]